MRGSRAVRPRAVLRTLLLCSGALIATLLLLEIAFRGFLRTTGEPYDAGDTRASLEALADPTGAGGASEFDPATGRDPSLVLHPYQGYDGRRALQHTIESEYWEGDESRTTIDVMVFGGSVANNFMQQGAQRFAQLVRADPRFAERELRMHTEARAGYKQPQQVARLAYLLALGARPDVVINLDGFNEVAVANENAATGVHPLYPMAGAWTPLAGLTQAGAEGQELLDRMQETRSNYQTLSRRVLRLGAYRSAVVGRLALKRIHALRAASAKAQTELLEFVRGSDVLGEVSGPPFDTEDVVGVAVRAWFECSLSLQDICSQRGIHYLHVLQPTLHDQGSKPLTESELAGSSCPESWVEGVRLGYPMLRERGLALGEAGVRFLDASMTFLEVEAALYYDACHFSERGSEMLGDVIAAWFLEGVGDPDELGLPKR